jgi:hypothetical protein
MRVWVRLRESMPLASLRSYKVVGGVSPFSSELDPRLLFLDGWLCILSVSQPISFCNAICSHAQTRTFVCSRFSFLSFVSICTHTWEPASLCVVASSVFLLSIYLSLPINRMNIKPSPHECMCCCGCPVRSLCVLCVLIVVGSFSLFLLGICVLVLANIHPLFQSLYCEIDRR